jgi:RNA polymerase sigma factor (sigma-70 family)
MASAVVGFQPTVLVARVGGDHEPAIMKINDPGPGVLLAATQGDMLALDRLLIAIQPGVYNLSVRVLGQRDDAADAAQEILLKVVTHLGSFRGNSSFTTWVWRVAHNHLMTAATRNAESPAVSLESIAERLDAGLDFASRSLTEGGDSASLTPQDQLEARQLALACTQSMLMALDREQRLIYLLDTVFDLPSKQAAEVVGISPVSYRQRLSRVRARLQSFMGQSCGLVAEDAACRCERQLPAVRHQQAKHTGRAKPPVVPIRAVGQHEAEQQFAAFKRICDVASVFRGHPDYQVPDKLRSAIRAVLTQEGFMQQERPQ